MGDADQVFAVDDVAYRAQLQRSVELAVASAEPLLKRICGPELERRRVAILPGSFNPPTIAHRALARGAVDDALADVAYFALSTFTVDKEAVTGAMLDDRLHMLNLLAREDERLGVLLLNRGLYVDQARQLAPVAGRPLFLVGFDKIVQIFDHRYYDDREAALEELFGLATFAVAPRGPSAQRELAQLLARPENRRFANAVRLIDLPLSMRGVASSSIRASSGRADSVASEVPSVVRAFIECSGVYDRSNHRYQAYRAQLAHASEPGRSP